MGDADIVMDVVNDDGTITTEALRTILAFTDITVPHGKQVTFEELSKESFKDVINTIIANMYKLFQSIIAAIKRLIVSIVTGTKLLEKHVAELKSTLGTLPDFKETKGGIESPAFTRKFAMICLSGLVQNNQLSYERILDAIKIATTPRNIGELNNSIAWGITNQDTFDKEYHIKEEDVPESDLLNFYVKRAFDYFNNHLNNVKNTITGKLKQSLVDDGIVPNSNTSVVIIPIEFHDNKLTGLYIIEDTGKIGFHTAATNSGQESLPLPRYSKQQVSNLLLELEKMLSNFNKYKGGVDNDVADGKALLKMTESLSKKFDSHDIKSTLSVINKSIVITGKAGNGCLLNYFYTMKNIAWLIEAQISVVEKKK